MNPVELYDRAAGRTTSNENPEESEALAAALEEAALEREQWTKLRISQAFLRGLEDKAQEYTERAGEHSTPLGDSKLCIYYLVLAVTLKKVITYARTGKYSD